MISTLAIAATLAIVSAQAPFNEGVKRNEVKNIHGSHQNTTSTHLVKREDATTTVISESKATDKSESKSESKASKSELKSESKQAKSSSKEAKKESKSAAAAVTGNSSSSTNATSSDSKPSTAKSKNAAALTGLSSGALAAAIFAFI